MASYPGPATQFYTMAQGVTARSIQSGDPFASIYGNGWPVNPFPSIPRFLLIHNPSIHDITLVR